MSEPDEWVIVGFVMGPHALRGAVMIKPLTRGAEEFMDAPLEKVRLRRAGVLLETLTFKTKAVHKGQIMATFVEIPDRVAAEGIAKSELVIPRTDRWELPEGKYYFDDLVGIELFDADSGKRLGVVIRAVEGGAHDYLAMEHPTVPRREVLIPLIPEFVPSVDTAARRALARLPEGLLDL